ncbi:MAG TPA: MFS transporter [Caulobacteraceae bacterium]|nr:MFS transporter [Caulobacteraceae bacterium]
MTGNSESGFWPVVRVASGNFLEMYDFMVFGYYAGAIGATFFPGRDAFAQLMLSFMTFGAGFLMRPLGAIVLGAYADRAGRRAGLLLTLTLMAIGTISLAVTPGYAAIGLAAPLLVLAGRLLQGFSAGMELGGVSVYLSEIAPPGRKGFYVAWQSASQQVAVVVAAVLGLVLAQRLGKPAMEAWGWRIPLWIGCLIVPVLFFLRRSLKETEAFEARSHPPATKILAALAGHWPVVLIGVLLTTMTTVSFYLITAYTPTFGAGVLHLSSIAAFVVTLCVGLSNLFWLPVMGAVSDRIGRRPLLIGCTVLMVATAYPAMIWLTRAPSFDRLLAVELWLSFLYASYNGAMVVFLTELVPAELRASGFSLAYSLATAIFGGFTPAISTFLIHHTGDKAMPGAWVSCAAVLGLAATLLTTRKLSPPGSSRRAMDADGAEAI